MNTIVVCLIYLAGCGSYSPWQAEVKGIVTEDLGIWYVVDFEADAKSQGACLQRGEFRPFVKQYVTANTCKVLQRGTKQAPKPKSKQDIELDAMLERL